MREVFEKIMEKLDELIDCNPIDEYEKGINSAASEAIEIVKQAADGDNNGWIPCSERLPENNADVLVWFEYFRYGNHKGLFQKVGISYTYDGQWSRFVNGQSGWSELKIIAWQPLPKPYKEKEINQKKD